MMKQQSLYYVLYKKIYNSQCQIYKSGHMEKVNIIGITLFIILTVLNFIQKTNTNNN